MELHIDYLEETDTASGELNEEDYDLLHSLIPAMDADIETWFGSSVACCDGCVEEYKEKWPLTYTRQDGLQDNRIDVETFYEGARRTRDTCNKTNYLRLLQYVACPNCGGPIGRTIYAVELPFDRDEFLPELTQLASIAALAPFLVLTDTFAQRVREEIKKRCTSITPSIQNGSFFRARQLDPASAKGDDFGAPPPSATVEGRYNHSGRPVLYLAETKLACWEECRRPTKVYSIATLEITKPIRVLDLSEPEVLSPVINAITYSNLMNAPSNGEGWDRPEWVLTRFVADCAIMEGIEAIRYPSTRTWSAKNLVILRRETFENSVRYVRHDRLQDPSPYKKPRPMPSGPRRFLSFLISWIRRLMFRT